MNIGHIAINFNFLIERDDITITNVTATVHRNRERMTDKRLERVRRLNEAGGIDAVERTLGISRSQAYRLIAQATKENDDAVQE